jgi:hypothetical protein
MQEICHQGAEARGCSYSKEWLAALEPNSTAANEARRLWQRGCGEPGGGEAEVEAEEGGGGAPEPADGEGGAGVVRRLLARLGGRRLRQPLLL